MSRGDIEFLLSDGSMRLGSAFGAFLDSVVDNVSYGCIYIALTMYKTFGGFCRPIPLLMMVPSTAIIGYNIHSERMTASKNGTILEVVPVNNLGKWKTVTQMSTLTILIVSRDRNVEWLSASGVGLLYVSGGLSVWSLVVYMRGIWKVLLKYSFT
ncbi:unnamed protein product [Brassica oleracea]|uniref:Uncharacterized protein n=3 Tax=Brassica TaxID=3705 RepID=A0A0D3BUC5_BRAOL|nr:unnamed protein product [Brassica napus]VDD08172.1 unnamed protein product [Brassica oleracea]